MTLFIYCIIADIQILSFFVKEHLEQREKNNLYLVIIYTKFIYSQELFFLLS